MIEIFKLTFKIIALVSMSVIMTGLIMKVANYVGERIGIYKILKDILKLISKSK